MSDLSKILIPNLIAQIEDLIKDCVKISRPHFIHFLTNKPLKSVIVGSGWFIVLNDSASPKMVIKIDFNIL